MEQTNERTNERKAFEFERRESLRRWKEGGIENGPSGGPSRREGQATPRPRTQVPAGVAEA